MTLVQNLRLPLSGNKYAVFAVVLLLFLSGCGLFGETEKRPERDRVYREDTVDVVEIDTFTIPVDSLDRPDRIIKREKYKVAIMLPFSLDSRFMYSYDFEDPKRSPYRSMLSLELYEGMLLAIEDLRRKGVRMEIWVFDTENSVEKVQNLLNRPIMEDMDLIIGPLFSKTLEVVAPFAKEHRIYMVSPLLPKVELTEPNPYYINATATVEGFAESIAEFAFNKYPRSRILVVTRDEEEGEKRYAQNIKKAYLNLKPGMGEIPKVEQVKIGSLASKMSMVDTNIVVVPAIEKWHIKTSAGALSSLAATYPMITIGMPNWFEQVQSLEEDRVYEQMSNINLHFPTTFYIDKESEEADAFNDRVKERFKIPATEYIYKGYHMMYYLGLVLHEYGVNFAEYMYETDKSITDAQFDFKPRLSDEEVKLKQSNIKYYENMYIPIIRLVDDKFIQVY